MNEEFLNKMKIYLQSEYEDYLKSLENEAYKGIRVNLLKTTPDELQEQHGKVAKWCDPWGADHDKGRLWAPLQSR